MAGGRPTKLTRALQTKLAEFIASNLPVEVAAAACGVSERSFHEWMRRGKEQAKGVFHDFRVAIDRANAEGEAALVLLVRKAATKDWRAAVQLLVRRYPARWGNNIQVEEVSREDRAAQIRDDIRMMEDSVPGPPEVEAARAALRAAEAKYQ